MHIGVRKASAHFQHRADTFQKNRTALDRHGVRGGHDGFQLRIGQAKHVPDDAAMATYDLSGLAGHCSDHAPLPSPPQQT